MYIIEKIKNLNIKRDMVIIILIVSIISLAEIKVLKGFMEYDSSTKLLVVYSKSINDLWIYFIPIIGLYLYLSNNLIDYNMEKWYIYKFKSKNCLIKSNILIVFIYTVFFSLLSNILLLLFLALNFDCTPNSQLVSFVIVSIILQSSVLFIYNLVCLLFDLIFFKNSQLVLLFLKASIFSFTLLGFNSSFKNVIQDIALYSFFTISNIANLNRTLFFSALTLGLIIHLFINFIIRFNEKFDYLKIPSYKDLI